MLIDPDLRHRMIGSLSWLVADARNRFDECRLNFEQGSHGGYSPELTEAMMLLQELELLVPAPTEQQCKDVAVMIGGTEDMGSDYYHQYNSQGWKKGNRLPITDVKSHMVRWKLKNQEQAPDGPVRKTKLFPLASGKTCSKCSMPAVYKASGGDYDFWYCVLHIPEKTKAAMRESGYDV